MCPGGTPASADQTRHSRRRFGMPMYDYACGACDHRFEVRQSFADDPLTECPECKGRIRRVIHAPGIVFKGSGFYKNDSRSESSRTDTASAPAAATEESKPAAETKPTTEAKPAAESK